MHTLQPRANTRVGIVVHLSYWGYSDPRPRALKKAFFSDGIIRIYRSLCLSLRTHPSISSTQTTDKIRIGLAEEMRVGTLAMKSWLSCQIFASDAVAGGALQRSSRD